MELTIRHITGSRAGQEQTVDSDPIIIGRNPASTIAFDPEKDLSVSGRHAEVAFRNGAWVIHDLGSSNGTFIGGERITERALRPGEIVQFGKNGPQVQFHFRADSPEVAPTVMPTEIQDIPMEGRTVAMMVSGAAPAAASQRIQAPAPPVVTRPKKKRNPVLVILLALGGVIALLVLAFAAIIFVGARSARQQLAAKSKVEQKKIEEANQIRQKIAAQREAASQAQEQLRNAQAATATSTAAATSTGNAEVSDLERQLQESQRMIEELTHQLQKKNDEITTVRTAPAPSAIPVIPRPKPAASAKPPVAAAKPKPQSAKKEAAVAAPPPVTVAPPAGLATGKALRKVVVVRGLPPEIPPANLPDETAGELASMVGRSLVAMGNYAVADSSVASISVTVTNFKSTKRTNVNLRGVADTASRIGGLVGKTTPQTPVDVSNVSYDAAMSARVNLYDRAGRSMGEFDPFSETKGTQSSLSFDPVGVPFRQVFGSDSPAGDVARSVVAQAVEAISAKMSQVEWALPYSGDTETRSVALDFGRNVGADIDDVFSVVDRSGRPIASLRIRELGETDSRADVIDGTVRGDHLMLRYLGSLNPKAVRAASQKTLRMRANTDVYDGPGKSFRKTKSLRKGTRVNYLYAVGLWAKANDRGSTFWVPLINAQIE